MKKRVLGVLALLFASLMSFTCDDEEQQSDFKVAISPEANYALSDTIWVRGWISAFIARNGDSVFMEGPRYTSFNIYKFKAPDREANCDPAALKFHVTAQVGSTFDSDCEQERIAISPVLYATDNLHRYRIGLKPLEPGNYLIEFAPRAQVTNTENHAEIARENGIPGRPNMYALRNCFPQFVRRSLDADNYYCFRVN